MMRRSRVFGRHWLPLITRISRVILTAGCHLAWEATPPAQDFLASRFWWGHLPQMGHILSIQHMIDHLFQRVFAYMDLPSLPVRS